MPTCDTIWPAWDFAVPNSTGVYAGIRTDGFGAASLEPVFEDYSNRVFYLKAEAAWGLFHRVAAWTLAFHFRIDFDGGGYVEEDVEIVATSVKYNPDNTSALGGTMGDETEIPKPGGWYGAPGDFEWTAHDPEEGDSPYTVIAPSMRMWWDVCYPPEDVALNVEVWRNVTFPMIDLQIIRDGNPVFEFGAYEGTPGSILITGTLPATHEGSFDGTGETGFILKLAMPYPLGTLSGSGTLTPSAWWAHDPEDGSGPLYDTSTGEFLRTPRLLA